MSAYMRIAMLPHIRYKQLFLYTSYMLQATSLRRSIMIA